MESCTVTVITPKEATADYVDEYGVNHGKGISLGGTVWAPVNCGYKAATIDADGNVIDKGFPYGKLYQWGRKYGQGYSLEYDFSVPKLQEGPVTFDYGQSDSMEGVFFFGNTEWSIGGYNYYWSKDPCPDGWRVPTPEELFGLMYEYTKSTSDQDEHYGIYFSGDYLKYDVLPEKVFFQAAGYRAPNGNADSRDSDGYYWSSRLMGNNGGHIYFDKRKVYKNVGYCCDVAGYSVRCVQE